MKPGACYPAFSADENDPVVRRSRHLCKDHEVRKIGGGTEAGYFQNVLGVPTVIVGPGPFDVAHLPNEYVTVEELDKCACFTMNLVKLYTDPAFVSKQ